MIWYDVMTKEPVAPGACEDGCAPSIDSYYCPTEKLMVHISQGEGYYSQGTAPGMICNNCQTLLLVAE